ncbi:Alpha/beta hydrolase family protein [Thiohalospira halophila DSM 15071]|uniref:Alpha/beta hydrolase family protein n=1 Tax=Thiohalospira halophila DSM 15071 TaxID=1123397 RepID=A0A1I1QMR7_9GAMM|nr:alpha/beta fold hydrolase [Thiohalospira halophila]SFD23349.1 Alpha/beta hydrolase family protein [Thiohalospira halophila DSM 15071]
MATVVLVHGLWMPGRDMALLARRLRRAGYHPEIFRYPTTRAPASAHGAELAGFVTRLPAGEVHLVGHSLGGLVIRHALNRGIDRGIDRPGRVVTLGTPHRGSSVACALAGRRTTRWLLGRAWEDGLDGDLPPWTGDRELGTIAGTRPHGVGQFFGSLERPHDGTVAVAETRLPGVPHATVTASHMGLLFHREAARLTATFLATGAFGEQPA